MEYKFEDLPRVIGEIHQMLMELKELAIVPQQREPVELDEIWGIEEAAAFLRKKVPTLYRMTSKREVPFSKQGNRLYFSKQDLIQHVKDSKKKTQLEIAQEAKQYLVGADKRPMGRRRRAA